MHYVKNSFINNLKLLLLNPQKFELIMKRIMMLMMIVIIISAQNAFGQEKENKHPVLTSKFYLGFGLYIPTQRVQFNVNADSEDQGINFDETFDFNNNQITPVVNFDWRFSKKWKLAAEYFNINYATSKVLPNDIEAGDYVFNKGSTVSVGYKINLARLFVGRIISTGLKHELGAGLGLHVLNLGPFIEGNVIVNGNENEFQRVDVSATAPLPNIALWYYFAPTEKWAFTAKVDWFGVTVDQYSGSLWDISPSVRYQIIKNLGVAVDYRFFGVRANINEEQWDGGVRLSFSGPTVTLIGNF